MCRCELVTRVQPKTIVMMQLTQTMHALASLKESQMWSQDVLLITLPCTQSGSSAYISDAINTNDACTCTPKREPGVEPRRITYYFALHTIWKFSI